MRRTRARLLAAAVVITTAGIAFAGLDLVVTNPAAEGWPNQGAIADAGDGSDAPDTGGFGSDGGVGSDAGNDADAGSDGGTGSDAGIDADAGDAGDGGNGAVLTVTPTMLDFLSVPVGETAAKTVTLRNSGSVPLTNIAIAPGTNAAHWILSDCTPAMPCALPSFGDQVIVTVTFKPLAHADKSTMAEVTSGQTMPQYIDLRGIGLGGVMAITNPSPTSGYDLDLGTIPRGQMTSAPITVRNNGNAPFTVTVGGASAPYTVMPATSVAVAAGAMTSFVVTCGSDMASPSNDQTFDVTSDAYMGSPEQVTVHCAIANTLVQVSPLAFDFGELRTNGGPQTKTMTVTVTNPSTSSAPARVHSMQLRESRDGLSLVPATTDTTLAVGEAASADLELTNASDTELAGQFLDILVDGATLALPVTGKVVTAHSRVVPAELDLGTACTGTQVSGNVMLVNDGTATLQVETPQLDQSFVASSPGTPAVLPPAMSVAAVVSPAMDATGTISGVLTWHDDVPTDHTIPVDLEYVVSGTAVSPRGIDFGTVEVDAPAPSQRIKLQNCDPTTAAIEIEALRTKSGTLGAWIVEPRVGFGKQLAGREEQAITVTFEPPARGRYEADLTLITGDDKQVIHLIGDATGRDFDRTSFYACACNGPGAPTGGWPIALAVALVIVRRRRESS